MKKYAEIVILILIMLAAAWMCAGVLGYGFSSPEDWDAPQQFSVDGSNYVCAGHIIIKTKLGPAFHEAGMIDETNEPSDEHMIGCKYYKSKDDPSIIFVYKPVYIRNSREEYRYVSFNRE